MVTIEFVVYLSKDLFSEGKFLYRKQVEVNNSVDFAYNRVIDALKLLYGSKCVIDIKIIP